MKGKKPFSRFAGAALGWVMFSASMTTAAVLSSRILDIRGAERREETKSAWTGGLLAEISRRPVYSFGYRNFFADIVWLQAVQVAGARAMIPADYDKLALLLNTAINFDPRFKIPYLLGGLMLGDHPEHAADAMQMLERGWSVHPDDWRFPFYAGYVRYFSLADPVGGGEALDAASRIPGSPPHLPLLAARMFAEGRAPETGLAFLEEMEKQEADSARREILRKRIREVIVERDIQRLERAVEAYRLRFGVIPEKLADLARAGLVDTIPAEPHGGRYLLSPRGEVRSDRVAQRLKVFRKHR